MKRQVALLIETSSEYGRNLLSGVTRYMRMHDQWLVYAEQCDLPLHPPRWLETWKGDGIISRATTPKLRQAVQRTGVPLVEVTDRYEDLDLPYVRSDDSAIGELAAAHLRERNFVRFAFCGYEGEAWSQRRENAFMAAVRDHTRDDVAVYNSVWQGPRALSSEDEQHAIVEWLHSIKRPFGIMACNDVRGRQVIDACQRIGMTVPQEVAIIGVDNDELLCRLCSPPLSSVMPAASVVGFQAAEMLDDMMCGRTVRSREQVIAPIGVATRQSTDVVAIEDQSIAAALHYIREHACRRISVDDVAEKSKVSRSTLERQFRKLVGRTPQEEIRYVQIQRVKELLTTTNLSISQIADYCGFEHPEYLHAVFKRFTAVTPGRFRKDTGVTSHQGRPRNATQGPVH